MKIHRTLLLALVGVILFAGTSLWQSEYVFSSQNPPPPKEYSLKVMKVKNQWKVVDASDSTKTTVKAKKGEKIVWYADGSDVYFQFMDEKLVGNYTRHLKDGQKLTLVIGNGAKAGANAYAVFCLEDKEYATGDSPPTIIVE